MVKVDAIKTKGFCAMLVELLCSPPQGKRRGKEREKEKKEREKRERKETRREADEADRACGASIKS